MGRLLLWLAGGLAIIFCAGLAFLWSVHSQVGGVSPDLPSADVLLAVRHDEGPVGVRVLTTSEQQMPVGELSHNAVRLEWPDGRSFLIDAGMDAVAAASFGEMVTMMSPGAEAVVHHGTVPDILSAEAVRRIAGVGFTHLHIDHVQGLVALCDAHAGLIRGVQTDDQRVQHNFNTSEGAGLIESSCLERVELPGKHLTPVPGFPGLAAISLGGHTPGSTLWVAALPEVVLLFSGDITNTMEEVMNDQPKPWLYSNVLVPENTARTGEIRRWLRQLQLDQAFSVVVSHDLASYDRRWFSR